MRAEQLTDPVTFHGEGAVWHDGWGGLKFVDMMEGDILSLRADGGVDRLHTGSPVAAMVRPRVGGGFVAATEREFGLWNAAGEREYQSAPVLPEGMRFNEGGCDPEGRLLCGSLAYGFEQGAGSLYRFEQVPDYDPSAALRTTRLFGDLTITNGLGFTADGRHMLYADTPTRRIDVFDVFDVFDVSGGPGSAHGVGGELENRRPFVSIAEGAGDPDGLTVDSQGGVWVALYGGSAVHHYDATGALADVIELPVSQPTSVTLGGPDLRTLYITTTREGLDEGAEPTAGALFTARSSVPGLPTLPFAG
jgi:sugar lactone lactonase YvrE